MEDYYLPRNSILEWNSDIMASFKMGLQCYQLFLLLTRSCEQVFQNEMIGERLFNWVSLNLLHQPIRTADNIPKSQWKLTGGNCSKRGKTRTIRSRLVLIFFLIGWEARLSFFRIIPGYNKRKSNCGNSFDTQLDIVWYRPNISPSYGHYGT